MSTKNVKANAEKKSQETATKTAKATTKTTTSKAKTTTAQEKKAETTAKAAKTTTPEQEKKTSDTVKMVGLVKTLRSVLDDVAKRDSALADKIKKALKSKTTKLETLDNLVKEVVALGNKPVVANEEKPAKKNVGGITRTTKTAEDKKTTKTGATSDSKTKATEKKSEKAAPKKKVTPKTEKKEEPAVKSVPSTGDTRSPWALIFPEKITTEVDGEKIDLKLAKDNEFLTIEEITNAMLSEGRTVVLACYWTARHIKEFDYTAMYKVFAPKQFDKDLDLTVAVVDCPKTKRIWAMSNVTEAMYYFEEEDLTPVKDKNPYNGEEYTVRVSNGMEFAIYYSEAQETESAEAEEETE